MAKNSKRSRKSKANRKGCSCKRIPPYKICNHINHEPAKKSPVSIINYAISALLWISSSSLIALFTAILVTSNTNINTTNYILSLNNPGFSLLGAVPVYALILLILFMIEKYNSDEYFQKILQSQFSQINFIFPICLTLIFLVIDRNMN